MLRGPFARAARLGYRSRYARDDGLGHMDFMLTTSDGSRIARRFAQQIYVMADMNHESPINPYTRNPFTREDERKIFERPYNRRSSRRAAVAATTYEAWKQGDGKPVYDKMVAERRAGDEGRERLRQEQDARFAESLAELTPEDQAVYTGEDEDEDDIWVNTTPIMHSLMSINESSPPWAVLVREIAALGCGLSKKMHDITGMYDNDHTVHVEALWRENASPGASNYYKVRVVVTNDRLANLLIANALSTDIMTQSSFYQFEDLLARDESQQLRLRRMSTVLSEVFFVARAQATVVQRARASAAAQAADAAARAMPPILVHAAQQLRVEHPCVSTTTASNGTTTLQIDVARVGATSALRELRRAGERMCQQAADADASIHIVMDAWPPSGLRLRTRRRAAGDQFEFAHAVSYGAHETLTEDDTLGILESLGDGQLFSLIMQLREAEDGETAPMLSHRLRRNGLDGARDAIRHWTRTDALREGVRLAGLTPHKQWHDARMLLPLSEAEFLHVLGSLLNDARDDSFSGSGLDLNVLDAAGRSPLSVAATVGAWAAHALLRRGGALPDLTHIDFDELSMLAQEAIDNAP